jgi:hypothetical protein
MDGNKKALVIMFLIILFVLLSLACNLPRPFVNAWFSNLGRTDREEATRELVDTTDATLVSAEGEILGLKPHEGTAWSCVDVNGEQGFFTNPDNLAEGQVVTRAVLDLSISYIGDDEGVSVNLLANFEKDLAVLDSVTNEFIAWDHTKTKKDGTGNEMILGDNGVFNGTLFITETREISYPETVSSTLEFKNNVFGLINPLDHKQAYFCDLSRNPFPENLNSLTAENFEERCILYYYECSIK